MLHDANVTCDHNTHLNVHLFRTTVASCACLCVGGTSHLNLPRRTSGSTRNHSPARIAPSRRAPGESQRGARHGRCPVPAIHLQARLHVTLAFPQRLCAIHPLHPSARWLPLFTRCLCWSRDSRSRSAHEHVAKTLCLYGFSQRLGDVRFLEPDCLQRESKSAHLKFHVIRFHGAPKFGLR